MLIDKHPLFLERLATVFLDKYDKEGSEAASQWFMGHLDPDHRAAVRPYIKKLVSKKEKKNDNE